MDQYFKNKEHIDNWISKLYEGPSSNWRTLVCGLGQILLSRLEGEALTFCGLATPCVWEEGSDHCEETSTYSTFYKHHL